MKPNQCGYCYEDRDYEECGKPTETHRFICDKHALEIESNNCRYCKCGADTFNEGHKLDCWKLRAEKYFKTGGLDLVKAAVKSHAGKFHEGQEIPVVDSAGKQVGSITVGKIEKRS